MNTSRKQTLAIDYRPSTATPIAIQAGTIRRGGAAPLLRKSIPAMMAAPCGRSVVAAV